MGEPTRIGPPDATDEAEQAQRDLERQLARWQRLASRQAAARQPCTCGEREHIEASLVGSRGLVERLDGSLERVHAERDEARGQVAALVGALRLTGAEAPNGRRCWCDRFGRLTRPDDQCEAINDLLADTSAAAEAWRAAVEARLLAKLKWNRDDVLLIRFSQDFIGEMAARDSEGWKLSYEVQANEDGTHDLRVTRTDDGWRERIERLARESEREACAALCDDWQEGKPSDDGTWAASELATAIRARARGEAT